MSKPLDVWLKFSEEDDEESEYEANTYPSEGGGFTVQWYHTAVGLVRSRWFATYDAATAWLTEEGFSDYSS